MISRIWLWLYREKLYFPNVCVDCYIWLADILPYTFLMCFHEIKYVLSGNEWPAATVVVVVQWDCCELNKRSSCRIDAAAKGQKHNNGRTELRKRDSWFVGSIGWELLWWLSGKQFVKSSPALGWVALWQDEWINSRWFCMSRYTTVIRRAAE